LYKACCDAYHNIQLVEHTGVDLHNNSVSYFEYSCSDSKCAQMGVLHPLSASLVGKLKTLCGCGHCVGHCFPKMRLAVVMVTTLNGNNTNALHLRDVKYGDWTVIVGNTRIPCHRDVLMKHSPVFAAMMQSNMKECETSSVHIKDFDEKTVTGMLSYMYSGWDNGEMNCIADKLVTIAQKYDIQTLKKSAVAALCVAVDDSSICTKLKFADLNGLDQLLNACVGYLRPPIVMKRIMVTDEWKEMATRTHPELTYRVYNAFIENIDDHEEQMQMDGDDGEEDENNSEDEEEEEEDEEDYDDDEFI